MSDWIVNETPVKRRVPDDANEWLKNGWYIDYIDYFIRKNDPWRAKIEWITIYALWDQML